MITANTQLPGAPLSPVSAMWDNVISWLEYSLREMRFSYSLTRVIISWPIVSIWRPLVHPTLRLSISIIFRLSLPLSVSISLPSSSASFPLPLYYSLSISQYLVHTPLAPCNFLLNLIILLSFFFSLSQLPHSLSPPSFSPLCPRESHISNERN